MIKIKWEDYGKSSLTMLAVYCDMDKESPSIPADPSDFKRCIHLLDCLDLQTYKIRDLLYKLSDKYDIWKPIVNNWNELIELYLEEKNKTKAPKLYKLLRKLNEQQLNDPKTNR